MYSVAGRKKGGYSSGNARGLLGFPLYGPPRIASQNPYYTNYGPPGLAQEVVCTNNPLRSRRTGPPTRRSRSLSPAPADCVMASDISSWTPCQNDRATAARSVDQLLPTMTTSQMLRGICGAKSSLCRVWPAQQQPSGCRGNRVWVCSRRLGRLAHMFCRVFPSPPSGS